MTVREIKSVAVIGAGPGGLVALHEFLTTKRDGQPSFDQVVVFEQKDKIGGVWAYSEEPDTVPAELLTKNYWEAETVQPTITAPGDLSNTSVDHPLTTKAVDNSNQWRRSGVYPQLYTNVPRRFLRFSSIPYSADKELTAIQPLITRNDVIKVLEDFAAKNSLEEHVRLNTQVQNVAKSDGKWELTLRHTNDDTDEWYTQSFDAVLVSTGHYSTPFIPYVPGLQTRAPDSYSHSKSFRSAEPFNDKTVLIVGSSLSGVDIVQYIASTSKLVISRTPGKEEIYPWLRKAAEDHDLKPRIKEIKGEQVIFQDGSDLKVDHIIFATGYHWHWPFFNDKIITLSAPGHQQTPTGASRVKGLYYNIFPLDDPTLAFSGVTISAVKFHTLEASAAAAAGVWSGQKSLPSREEQEKWIADRLAATSDDILFHYYHYSQAKEQWFDPVVEKFAVKGRINPLEGEDIGDLDKALVAAEKAFYGVRDGDPLYAGF